MDGQKVPQLQPKLGQRAMPVECYSRVVGYYRPITTQSNPGKQSEFKDRKEFNVNKWSREQ